MPTRPIPDSYWVRTGRLLADEYPGAPVKVAARAKLRQLLAVILGFFLDLTEVGEHDLRPQERPAQKEAFALGRSVVHRRLPIRDRCAPSRDGKAAILATLHEALEAGHTAYVHFWGGVGRTGTVVGCYLVRRGRTAREAIADIARWRAGTPDGHRPWPETPAQRAFVRAWSTIGGSG
jgi:hypothetical protein